MEGTEPQSADSTDKEMQSDNDMENESHMEEEEEKSEHEKQSDLEDDSDDSKDDEEDKEEAEVRALQQHLAQNPYDYASHVTLISKLQRLGELDHLRLARESMSTKYPLSTELWLAWLKDEIKLATTPEQKAEVVTLCERAVKDYLSIEIWLEYLQFSIGNMGTEEDAAKNVRQLFERALTAIGLHCIKGAIIWEAFREFEVALCALVDPSNHAERKEQLTRIANLFRRQLACPLLDMEKTYEEFLSWRSNEGAEANIDDKIVKGGYERALAQFNSRLPFEEKIVSAQGDSEQLDAYRAYLLHEKQNGDPGRMCVLYERAVADLSLESSLWLDYLIYLEDNIKIEDVLEQVYERASRNVPWCSPIWRKWIRSREKWGKSVLEVQNLLENALQGGFPTAEDYRKLWLAYLEFLRRKLDDTGGEKQLEVLRNAFNRACEYLAKAFGLEGDPLCTILQFWARTEAIHGGNMEKARSLWADIMSQGHSGTASYWLEYISLERCYGDTKHLRKLFQKALTSVKDWPESIANAWIDFERDEGSLEQMENCETKTREKLEKIAEERQKSQVTHEDHTSPQSKKTGKRKTEAGGRWTNLGASASKFVKTERSLKARDDRSSLGKDKDEKLERENKGTKEQEMEIDTPANTQDVDEKITVFVSNLDYSATEEEIREALEPAGPITLFKMIRDYKGRSKGYCYVQLNSTDAVEKALSLDRTPIRSRPMFVSRCDPNKSTRAPGFKYSCTLEKNKLFVKGLPLTTTKEELENIFKVHGKLKDVRLVTYRNGHSKGLAYVDFEDETNAANAVLATDGTMIGDKQISVAISQPPTRKRPPGSEQQAIPPPQSLGAGRSARSTGAPMTVLSMIPQSVRRPGASGASSGTENGVAQPMSNQDFRKMFLNKK